MVLAPGQLSYYCWSGVMGRGRGYMSVCDLLTVVVHHSRYTRLVCFVILELYVSMLCQWPSAQKQISLCLVYLLGVCVCVSIRHVVW